VLVVLVEWAQPYAFLGQDYWYHSDMAQNQTNRLQRNPMWRIAIEILLIVFLLFAVRLMGEFTATNDQGKSLALALNEIITLTNCAVSTISALMGTVVIEFVRKKL
jgi:hypothetical protein